MGEDENGQPPAKRGGGATSTIVALAVLTVLAGGAGALTGTLLASNAPAAAAPVAEAPAPEDSEAPADEKPATLLLALKPIVANIAAPADVVVRLESSLVLTGETEEAPEILAARIEADTATFLRTVQLAQLEGARGITHLREDLLERARMRSPAVSDLLILTLVAE